MARAVGLRFDGGSLPWGGLVRMLYDKLLFVATAEVDVVVGSLSMHTLHFFHL